MRMFGSVLIAGAMAGAMLAGCGGSDGSAPVRNLQSGHGISVGEPNGGAPVVSEYVKLAQDASCASLRNRLFLIDNKYVFWERVGECADASNAQTLMGATPQAVLCSAGDSIAGPRTTCQDETARPMFETILKNLDKVDLGLGSGRKVEQIRFLPKSGEAVSFQTVVRNAFSGVQDKRQVVVKDAAAWAALWADHSRNTPTPRPLPDVDFSQKMVIGVFSGNFSNGCTTTSVVRTASRDGKLVVEYEERDFTAVAICIAAVTQPMHIVTVDRVDAPVEFVKVATELVDFRTLGADTRTRITSPRKVVIKDSAAWEQLWKEAAGPDVKAPAVDFSKEMVIGVFLGARPDGCHGTGIESITRQADRLIVRHVDTVPGPDVFCTMAIVFPDHIVAVPRSDLKVEFASEIRVLQLSQ